MKNYFYKILAVGFFAGALLTSCGDDDVTPKIAKVTPEQAPSNEVVTVTGSGLRNIMSITFETGNVPASFTSTFNTDGAIVFRVPGAAVPGQQNIIFKNKDGKEFTLPFKVLGLPSITDAFPYDFEEGSTITLNGANLQSVTKVVLQGTTDEAEIVSQTATELVVKMPASANASTALVITNDAGNYTTSIKFNNLDEPTHQFIIFTESINWSTVNDWSWCKDHKNSTDFFVTGANSYAATYGAGSWAALSIHFAPNITTSDYSFLTFYVKGADVDTQIDVASEQGGNTNTITVPANVWTYFKMPINGFIGGLSMERLDFKMHGPDDADKTVYYDNIILLK
jgi:hypothetical protein